MTPRNTNTGGVLEAMILSALKRGHYSYEAQVKAGTRCGGSTHKVDALAQKDSAKVLVSLKWQQTGGTAEQKGRSRSCVLPTPFARGMPTAPMWCSAATDGLRDYYTSGALADDLIHAALVRVVTLEAFVRLANNG